MIEWSEHHRASGRTIAFVPTMGCLHEGHLALMRAAKKLGDRLVVSIFVNPAQFGPAEDFNAYPRDLVRDLAMAESVGADAVFTPSATDMYPEGSDTQVCQQRLPAHLCGLSRPGHFTGVLTVVAKLFHIINPHSAVFGQKDWQQLAVIKKMVKDLNFGIHIVDMPTVREHDGLAMSSRNARLDPRHREAALTLYHVLAHARKQIRGGQHKASAIIRSAENRILQYPENRIDYIRICHPDTLDDVADIEGPTLMALAVFVGGVRLIDNMMLQPSNGPPGHKIVRGTAS